MALVAKISELVRRAFSRILRYPKHVLVPALVVLLIGVVGLATLPLRAAAGFQGSKTTPTPTVRLDTNASLSLGRPEDHVEPGYAGALRHSAPALHDHPTQ